MAQEIYHRSEWGNPSEQWGNVYLNADLTNELYKRASEYENSWVTDQLLNGVGTKPSIILTPTAYEDGKLNSVKPKGGENLLTYSEDFSQSNWQKYQISLNSNNTISPDGTQNASEITINSSTPSLGDTSLSLTVGDTYTLSCFVKKGTNRWVRLASVSSGSLGAWFDLENNVVGTVNSTFASIENYGNGWYRISNTITAISGTNQAFIGLSDADGGTSSTQVGNTVYVWGFQVERGSKTSTYISTNGTAYKNADFDFTRGSSATRVNEKGLVQDVQILSGELVQNGDFEEIGSELVTNGDFATDSDWTKQIGTTISNGQANFVNASGVALYQNVGTQTTFLKVTFEVTQYTSGVLKVYSGSNENIADTNIVGFSSIGLHTRYVPRSGTNGNIIFGSSSGEAFNGSIDNVSVKEVGQNWTFGAGWSIAEINGNQVAEFDGGADAAIQQGSLLTSGKKYRLSIDVANNTTGSLQIRFGNTGVVDETITTNGTFTYDLVSDGTRLYLRSISGFDGYIDNISVIEITDDTDLPRINYTNFDYENGEVVPYSGEGSLLLEPQSTNLITYSEDFSQSYWLKLNNVTVSAEKVISPDGTLNASQLIFDGTSGGRIERGLTGLTQGADYTVSVYARVSSGTQIVRFGSVNDFEYTLTTEWQRLTSTETENDTAGYPRLRCNDAATIEVWGFQLEQLSYATSYIPTNGSTVTRLADVCNNSGNSDLINSTEGVLYAEISALDNTADNSKYITISDGTYNNRASILFSNGSTNQIRTFLRVGGVSQIDVSDNVTDITDFNKVAFSYKENDFKVYINGSLVSSDTSGSVWSEDTITKLSFSEINTSAGLFNGNVKSVAVFKEALSDAELQKLTTI